MAAPSITASGTVLPSPDSIIRTDEIIWSENTGRATNGKMGGDVVAEKRTFDIKWGMLTQNQYDTIKQKMPAGFFSAIVSIGSDTASMQAYRSNFSGETVYAGGQTYVKGLSVQVIEQ